MEPDENIYTKKVDVPQYEIKNEQPTIERLYNTEKTEKLIKEIRASNISEEEKTFLLLAAQRHIVFNFKNIAEYYAYATEEMQDLMEKSALVIIDYDKCIRYGYSKLEESILDMRIEDAENEE